MQKESPQAVSETDRFVEFFEKTLAFAKANKDKVMLGISVGVLLLVIITGVGFYKQKVNRDASLAFQGQKSDFQTLVEAEGRKTALTRWLAEAPAAIDGLKGGASSYEAALLWYGGLAFENGDFESAARWYGEAAKGFDANSSLRNIAWCGQAQSLEQQGKPEAAAPLYEKIRGSESPVKRDEATFHLARIHEARGDSEGAEGLYREVMDSVSSSPYKELAAEKVAGM